MTAMQQLLGLASKLANHPVKAVQEGVGCVQGDFGVRIKKSGDEQGKSDMIKGRGHIEGVGLVRPTE